MDSADHLFVTADSSRNVSVFDIRNMAAALQARYFACCLSPPRLRVERYRPFVLPQKSESPLPTALCSA